MAEPEPPPARPLRRPLLGPESIADAQSGLEEVGEAVWVEVIHKMDEVYNDLLQYEVVLEQKNAALEDSQQFIESVLASMSDILIVCNRHGAIQEVNDSLRRCVGLDESHLRGRPLADLFADEASRQRARDFFSAARPLAVQDCELLISGRDGSPLPVSLNCTPRLSGTGKLWSEWSSPAARWGSCGGLTTPCDRRTRISSGRSSNSCRPRRWPHSAVSLPGWRTS